MIRPFDSTNAGYQAAAATQKYRSQQAQKAHTAIIGYIKGRVQETELE